MLQGLLTPCKKCTEGKCGLWVTLTWQEEMTKKEEKRSECAITGIYGFLARLENRSIATQQASEQSRNNSAKVQVETEKITKLFDNLSNNLKNGLAMYLQHIDDKINALTEKIDGVVLIGGDINAQIKNK